MSILWLILAIAIFIFGLLVLFYGLSAKGIYFTELGDNEIRFVVDGSNSPKAVRVLADIKGWRFDRTSERMVPCNIPSGPSRFLGRVFISWRYPFRELLKYNFQWDEWGPKNDEKGIQELRRRGYDGDEVTTSFLKFDGIYALNVPGIELADGDVVQLQFQVLTRSTAPLIPIFTRNRKTWAVDFLGKLRGIVTNAGRKVSGEQLKKLEMIVPITSKEEAQRFLVTKRTPNATTEQRVDEEAGEKFWEEIVDALNSQRDGFEHDFGQQITGLQYLGYTNPRQASLQKMKDATRDGEALVERKRLEANSKVHEARGIAAELNAEVGALGVQGAIAVRKAAAIRATTYIEGGGQGIVPTIQVGK